ncbi:MAG: Arc family DNA-binding protein [Peptostreptococcaceae bacterium]|nr:Arc family DNA-binding protein [Peptostreptococcaceae bacterium]
MNENIKRFTFRIPESLFDEIEQLAKTNYRSVNAEIIIAIEQYLKSSSSSSEEPQQSKSE